uniref:Cystinosin homolog n=1 Tax=Panagrellus redivivus TaxID=6233 RepID=A0A7E4VHQ4_PANRE
MFAMKFLVFTTLLVLARGQRFIDPDLVVDAVSADRLKGTPDDLNIVKGETDVVTFSYTGSNLSDTVRVTFNTSSSLKLTPTSVILGPDTRSATIDVTGVDVTSRTFIDVQGCAVVDNGNGSCPFSQQDSFVRVKVVHSKVLSIFVIITGWVYFFAWSISFYPQIWLNYQRSSVEGLNFDFLVLNILGFLCYTIYNWLMFFDHQVQDIYHEHHPRSLIPVLANDVVFATHALLACIVTGIQCFFYERGTQRVSYICMAWGTVLALFAVGSFVVTAFDVINWLQFINNLSYVKMAVTLSKYFPQAILNFKRKSTTGWSIGNVLLDFTGGSMDITQMVLQASNTDDWSGFTGNPVKFGLGLVSMIFDVVFMIQHYGLYRNSEGPVSYDVVDTGDSTTTSQRNSDPVLPA